MLGNFYNMHVVSKDMHMFQRTTLKLSDTIKITFTLPNIFARNNFMQCVKAILKFFRFIYFFLSAESSYLILHCLNYHDILHTKVCIQP